MSTFELIQRILFQALASAGAFSDEEVGLSTLGALGWALTSVPPALAPVAAAGSSLRALWDQVTDAELTPAQLAALLDQLDATWDALAALANMPAPPGLEATSFVADLARDLVDLWLIEAIEAHTMTVVPLLSLFGLIEIRMDAGDAVRRPYVMRRIFWDRIASALRDPAAPFRSAFGWGQATFDAERALGAIADLLASLRNQVEIRESPADGPGVSPPPDRLSMGVNLVLVERAVIGVGNIVAALRVRPWHEPPGLLGLAVEPIVDAGIGLSFPIDDHAQVFIEASADVTAGLIAVIEPERGLWLRTQAAPAEIDAACVARIVVDDPERPRVTLLSLPGVALTASTMQGRAWFAKVSDQPDIGLEVFAEDARFAVDTTDTPGVLQRVIGSRRWEVGGAVGVGWSSMRGLFFRGGGLGVHVPASIALGPVRLEGLTVSAGVDDDLRLSVGTDGRIALGAVALSWQGLGAAVRLTAPQGISPAIGVDVDWQLPTGLGLAIETAMVSGAGAIARDGDSYAGALALDALGVALSAYGVLDTAGTGYSLAAIVSAQFQPIQLGLGFTLNGVGGLVAVNRRIDVQALESAMLGPGLTDIFFADDLIRQASRLAGELGTYFPVAQGRHVFGPAAKLGWGTPQLISADVAILLEVPSPVRVIVLGHAHAELPSESAKLIELNFDVLGSIAFEQKTFDVYAQLRDSKVLGFTIEGGMGLKVWWGDPPNFVFSVGGLSPRFPPPAGFRVPQPLRIPLGFDDDPRLDVTGYLALTPNSAQIGANVELYASASALNIRGHFDFDALFVWSPFSVTVDIDAGVQLRRNNTVLAGIGLHGTLTGPGPWKVKGKACLSCWFVDLCVPFSASFGGSVDTTAPQLYPWLDLQDAIAETRNWAGRPASRQYRSVVLGKAIGVATPPIDPSGNATFRQNVIPLDRKLDKYQNAKPIGPDRYKLTEVRVGGKVATKVLVTDWLAPDQFEDLTDDERLSRGSYERMVTGVTIASDVTQIGRAFLKPLEYETIELKQEWEVIPHATFSPSKTRQLAGARLGAAAASLSDRRGTFAPPAGKPPLVRLEDESFVVVSSVDMSPRPAVTEATTKGGAMAALNDWLHDHPEDAGSLQVVPLHEAA